MSIAVHDKPTSYYRLFVRPDVAFILVWAVVFFLYSFHISRFFPAPQWQIFAMIGGSAIIGLASAALWSRALKADELVPGVAILESETSWRIVVGLVAAWFVGFVVIVTYSHGLPIYWYVAGVPRSYVEYGMPTFSGAWNTLRVVLGILAAFKVVRGRNFELRAALVLIFLSATVLAEVNRGGFVLFALNILAAGVLAGRTLSRQIVWSLVAVAAILGGIYAMGSVRSSAPDTSVAVQYPLTENDGSPPVGDIGRTVFDNPGVAWVYLYLTSPVANLHLAATRDLPSPPYPGYYTLYPMLPSVIRPVLPEETRYPLPLVLQGYTMTTAYGPGVADFGFLGASIAMGLQLALSTLVFRLSRRYAWALILAPMLFATAVLSFFSNYFFTLLTPFHAVLAVALPPIIAKISANSASRRNDYQVAD